MRLAERLRLPDNKELRDGLINTVAYYGKNNALSIAHDRTRTSHSDLTDGVVSAVHGLSYRDEKPESEYILKEISIYGSLWERNPKYKEH